MVQIYWNICWSERNWHQCIRSLHVRTNNKSGEDERNGPTVLDPMNILETFNRAQYLFVLLSGTMKPLRFLLAVCHILLVSASLTWCWLLCINAVCLQSVYTVKENVWPTEQISSLCCHHAERELMSHQMKAHLFSQSAVKCRAVTLLFPVEGIIKLFF